MPGTPVRQVTDSRGMISLVGGIFRDELGAHSLGE